MVLGYDPTLVVALLAGLLGGMLRGFSGFGFGMAAVPVLITRMPPVYAIPAVLVLEVVIGAASAPGLQKFVAWDRLGILLLGSLIGTPVGLAILTLIPATIMRPAIAVTILASVVVLWTMARPNLTLTPVSLGCAGVVSGILNGSTAASGPPAIILLFASNTPAKNIRSLLIFFVLASTGIAVSIAAISGLVVLPVFEISAFMLPGVLVGFPIGERLFRHLHTRHYRKISLVLLFAVSVAALGVDLLPVS